MGRGLSLSTIALMSLLGGSVVADAGTGSADFPNGAWDPSSTSAKIVGHIRIEGNTIDWYDHHRARMNAVSGTRDTFKLVFGSDDDERVAAAMCDGIPVTYVRLLPKTFDDRQFLEMTAFSGQDLAKVSDKNNRDICGKYYFKK